MDREWIWLAVGFCGQALFSVRFLIQWLSSERKGRSVVTAAYWYFSAMGGATLLAYALYRADPVFVAGEVAGLFVYARNLQLIMLEHRQP